MIFGDNSRVHFMCVVLSTAVEKPTFKVTPSMHDLHCVCSELGITPSNPWLLYLHKALYHLNNVAVLLYPPTINLDRALEDVRQTIGEWCNSKTSNYFGIAIPGGVIRDQKHVLEFVMAYSDSFGVHTMFHLDP